MSSTTATPFPHAATPPTQEEEWVDCFLCSGLFCHEYLYFEEESKNGSWTTLQVPKWIFVHWWQMTECHKGSWVSEKVQNALKTPATGIRTNHVNKLIITNSFVPCVGSCIVHHNVTSVGIIVLKHPWMFCPNCLTLPWNFWLGWPRIKPLVDLMVKQLPTAIISFVSFLLSTTVSMILHCTHHNSTSLGDQSECLHAL